MKMEKLSLIPCTAFKSMKKAEKKTKPPAGWRAAWKKQESLGTGKSLEWQGLNYEQYQIGKKEWLYYGSHGVAALGLIVYVFYRSLPVIIALLPLGIAYPLFIKEDLKRKRMETLRLQFKDAILAVAEGLHAGYSVENAFAASLREMEQLYGKDSMIAGELRLILHKTAYNQTFEEAFRDFAARSGLEDVQSFADVFTAAQKSGGELMKIIARTAEIIGEKIRIQEDILTATASRRMEQKIMSGIPILIVFYIEFTSPGFFDVLYESVPGRLLMTVCLFVYFISCITAKRILEIET